MGVYKRPDSPYFWLHIPARPLQDGTVGAATRERTNILAADANRPLADRLFEARMHALAIQTHFSTPPRTRRRSKETGWTYIYFATDGEMVKIGRAINVVHRLSGLQISSTRRISILATMLAHASVERLIHRKFSHLRKTGEWFQMAPDLQDFIDAVRAGRDVISDLVEPHTLPRGILRWQKRKPRISSHSRPDPSTEKPAETLSISTED